jgi:hypothetical protein
MHTNYSQVDLFFMKEILQIKCKIVSKYLLTINGKVKVVKMFLIWKLFLHK